MVTGGGIIGTITKAADDELTVEISEGVRVKVLRGTVSSVLAKPEPAKGGGRGRERDEEDAEEEEAEEAAEAPAAEETAEKPARRGLGRALSRR